MNLLLKTWQTIGLSNDWLPQNDQITPENNFIEFKGFLTKAFETKEND